MVNSYKIFKSQMMIQKNIAIVQLAIVIILLTKSRIACAQNNDLFVRTVFHPLSISSMNLEQIRPEFVIDWLPSPLIFSEEYGAYLSIFRLNKNHHWNVFHFNTDHLDRHYWVGVFIASDLPYIWGIAEYGYGDQGERLEIIMSADYGETFCHVASLLKPHYSAEFRAFHMNQKGYGQLVIYNEESSFHSGYYIYKTSDWGNSWSQPDYAPDILSQILRSSGTYSSLKDAMKRVERFSSP